MQQSEDLFSQHMRAWRDHVRALNGSCDPSAYIDCDAYRELASYRMREPVLTGLCRMLTDSPDLVPEHGVPELLMSQLGDAFWLPRGLENDPDRSRQYCGAFLRDYFRHRSCQRPSY